MAASKVELVFTGDDSKAMQAAAKLLDAARQTGDAWDGAGRKQKGALDAVLPMMQSVLGVSFSIGGALKLVNDYFESMQQKAAAVGQEMERIGQRTTSYSEAFGRLMMNMPGATSAELQQIDSMIRNLSASNPIGRGALGKLTDAMTMIQSGVPTAPMSAKTAALAEAAQSLGLEPTADAAGIGLGIAKIMEGSGFKLSANQAQNLLTQQQMLGAVQDPGKVSRMQASLAISARESGMDIPGMMGMAAWTSQMITDLEGNETTTILGSLSQKLIKNEGDIEKLARGLDLSGSLSDRMRQLAEARASGKIGDAALMEMFPKMGARGVGGMTLLSAVMDPERGAMLEDFMGRMRAPGVLQGDAMADSIAAKRGILSFGEDMATRQLVGALEAESVTRSPLARLQSERERLKARMDAALLSQAEIEYGMNAYTIQRIGWRGGPQGGGQSEEAAAAYAMEAAEQPRMLRKLGGGATAAGAALRMDALRSGEGTIDGEALTKAVRQGVVQGARAARAESGTPAPAIEDH